MKAAIKDTAKHKEVEATELVLDIDQTKYFVLTSDGKRINCADLLAMLCRYKEVQETHAVKRILKRPIISMREAGILMGFPKRIAARKARLILRGSTALIKVEGRMYVRTRGLIELNRTLIEDIALMAEAEL